MPLPPGLRPPDKDATILTTQDGHDPTAGVGRAARNPRPVSTAYGERGDISRADIEVIEDFGDSG